jgi:hypothetical protein
MKRNFLIESGRKAVAMAAQPAMCVALGRRTGVAPVSIFKAFTRLAVRYVIGINCSERSVGLKSPTGATPVLQT